MTRLEKLEICLDLLENYHNCYENGAEQAKQMSEFINGLQFLDETAVQKWKGYLDTVLDCTLKLKASYMAAGLGEFPSNPFEAGKKAKDVYERLVSRQMYVDAVDFVRSLTCADAKLRSILEAVQGALPTQDILQIEDDQELEALEKYVFLENACKASTKNIRFTELLKVGTAMDSSLLYAVLETPEVFTIAEELPEPATNLAPESEAPVTNTVVAETKIEKVVAAAEPVPATVPDVTAEPVAVAESVVAVSSAEAINEPVAVTESVTVAEPVVEIPSAETINEPVAVVEAEEENNSDEAARLAFATQSPSVISKTVPNKKDGGNYTINKFKIESKGEDDSVLNLVYRLLDKYGYVSLQSPDIPAEKQEEVENILERHRKRGYLIKVTAKDRCSFYCLAVKGTQAIKDGAFRSYVNLGKNNKRADIHNFRSMNDFNICSYVQLRDTLRAAGVKAMDYEEKEQVNKACYSMNYTALKAGLPDVRVIGFTNMSATETNAMLARLAMIKPERELVLLAGLNQMTADQAAAWAKNSLGQAFAPDQFFTYNATDKNFASLADGTIYTAFEDVYAKFLPEIEAIAEPAIEASAVENAAEPEVVPAAPGEVVAPEAVAEAKTEEPPHAPVEPSPSQEPAEVAVAEEPEAKVEVPENILVTLDDVKHEIISTPEKESKSSSPKEFKKVLQKNGIRATAFAFANNNHCINTEMLSGIVELPKETCAFELNQLVNMGLMRKLTYKDYEPYYMPSPKAKKLCQAETIKSFLGVENCKKQMPDSIWEDKHPLMILSFLDGIKSLGQAIRFGKMDSMCLMSSHSFAFGGKPNNASYRLWVTGIFAEKAADFLDFALDMDKVSKEMLLNVIIVLNHEQGKSLLQYWQDKYPEVDHAAIGYKLLGEETIYTLAENKQYDSVQAMFKGLLDNVQNELKQKKAEQKDLVEEIEAEKASLKENKAAPAEPKEQEEKPALKSTPVTVIEAEPEPENLVLEHPDKQAYLNNYLKIVGQGKAYAACAYLKVLSEKDKSFAPLYKQLAYATGDPLGGCTYTSQVINEVFYGEEEHDDYLLIAAALRNFFYDYYSYDYYISQLMGMLKNNTLIEKCNELYMLLQDMANFKKEYNSSVDCYADYHSSSNVDIDKELNALKHYASEQFNHYCVKFKEDISNRRFSEARKVVLAKDGPLGTYLQKVIAGDDSAATIGAMRSFLLETYITDGAIVRKENISHDKIEAVIDAAWNKAADKLNCVIKTSDLMSALRTKFYNQIDRLVTPLCDFVALNDAKIPVDNPEASQSYKKMRTRLLKNLEAAEKFAMDEMANNNPTANVLKETLMHIRSCINGTHKAGAEKYFYLDFLKTDNVLLDENFLPYLNEVAEDLPALSVLRRIERHISTKELPLEQRAQNLLDSEDNYSSLNCILAYLELDSPGYTDKFSKEKSLKLSLENAAAELDIYREEFENDIELRQSYGQIDETEDNRKEKLLKIVDAWYEWAKESQNYGFFHKICDALLAKIEVDALPRGNQLQKRLDKFVRDNPARMQDETVEAAVNTVKERIRIKNYAAAEDLLNRLNAADDALFPVKNVIETDYLQNFIRDFNACYRDVSNMTVNFKNVLLGQAPNNKDGKAANRMLENWMYRPEDCSVERVKALLTSLDFAVGTVVERKKVGNNRLFDVTLARPEDGRKVKHKHPIAAFGSIAETDPFRVAFIFGNFGAEDLLDVFNKLGDAQHTLVFMDGALAMSARRTLARKTKEVTSKTFAVIDRVVLAFLHRNYRLATVQKMLMSIIIPFAFCQPYVVDAFVMPPEIFIGREEELKQIEAADGVNIVYGGRQLGKSAMLRMAVNDVDRNERGDRAVFVDIANLDYKAACRKVSMVLNEDGILDNNDYTDDWSELCHRLRLRLKSEENRIPYLLLLLDEADEFIKTAATVNYSPLENLKDVQGIGVGRFKFVFAGLRDVIRFDRNQALSNNSVMTKLSKLTVKPFNVNEARVLLEQPLSYLGLRFAKDEATESLIASIFSATNYFPGLLQLYCANLVKALQKPDYAGYDEIDTPSYEVSVEHIKKVLGGKELQSQIRDKFFITLQLGENEDKYYYIIAHLIALQHHRDAENSDVTPQMVLDLAEEYAIKRITDLDEQKVYALMEELCELNILHTSGNGYRFTRYSFYQMMGSVEHIENELLNFLED